MLLPITFSNFDFSDSEITAFKNGSFSPSQHQALSFGFNLKGDLDLMLGAAYDKYQVIGKSIDMELRVIGVVQCQ